MNTDRPLIVDQFIRTVNPGTELDAFADFMSVLDTAQQEAIVRYMMAKGVKTLSPQWMIFSIVADLLRNVQHAAHTAGQPLSSAVETLIGTSKIFALKADDIRTDTTSLAGSVTSTKAMLDGVRALLHNLTDIIKSAAKEELSAQEERWNAALVQLRREDNRKIKFFAAICGFIAVLCLAGGAFIGWGLGERSGDNSALASALYSNIHRQVLVNMLQEAKQQRNSAAASYIRERLRH